MWYSFNVSNVHFVCLDTGETDNGETALLQSQASWLESDLAAAKAAGYKWTIAYFHRPPYSTDASHGNQSDVSEIFVPIFDKYNVDLVLLGHVHMYERDYPMRGGKVVNYSKNVYNNPNGTIYVIAGSIGAPLYELGKGDWVAASASEYHYCMVHVLSNNTLRLEAKNLDGKTFDWISISKQSSYGDGSGGYVESHFNMKAGITIVQIFVVVIGALFLLLLLLMRRKE
jgi:hypothetical protein